MKDIKLSLLMYHDDNKMHIGKLKKDIKIEPHVLKKQPERT